jgi:hypothetical protein
MKKEIVPRSKKPYPFFPYPGCVHADPIQNAKLIKKKTIKEEKKRRPEDHASPGTENAFIVLLENDSKLRHLSCSRASSASADVMLLRSFLGSTFVLAPWTVVKSCTEKRAALIVRCRVMCVVW